MADLTGSATQRRHDPRHKMFGPVALRTGDIAFRAHFLDLSCSGALAHSETPPTDGASLTVEALGLEARGRVIWINGKRFGIQFNTPLTPAMMTRWIEGR
ncbi:PilZ domain-containing protein [Sphingobium sp.]|uniref:PilZ domain-containing protein n=1 Tax=Sphingobium sp. TaxID=1912891 RepID=UPI0028BDBBD5|nr:PilZ domain-containing protein [Sphingobium sp.]